MLKLDLLDKKIINALNQDPRASFSTIAKKANTSKEVVNYRVKRLQDQGLIKEFVTIFGFGYWAHKVLLDFAKISTEQEKSTINYLKEHPHVNWVTPCTGGWDLVFAIMAKDPEQFDHVLREILNHIGNHLQNYKIATSIDAQTFGHTYILGTVKETKKIKRITPDKLDFDHKDKKIAQILHKNARAKIIDIYKKTKIPVDTIKYRIKKMEENSIIKRYRVILDTSQLDYHRYEIFLRCINLSDSLVNKFREYAKQKPNIEYFSRCVGSWDIEFTVHLKTSQDLRDFILEVKKQFGDYIQKFETLTLFDTYNFVYFPEELR